MIPVICHTNLDLAYEKFPTELPCVPRVGEEIQSATIHRGTFQLSLQVVAVRYEHSPVTNNWYVKLELHMTEFQKRIPSKSVRGQTGSIIAFYEWYAPLVGRSVSSFI